MSCRYGIKRKRSSSVIKRRTPTEYLKGFRPLFGNSLLQQKDKQVEDGVGGGVRVAWGAEICLEDSEGT